MNGARARWLALVALLVPGAAAARPTLSGPEVSYGVGGGTVLIHYTISGADAVPADDADTDGVPDFVEECADVAEQAMALYAADGFRAPVSDAGVTPDNGGDGRTDLYLRNLQNADGNTTTEGCSAGACIAFGVVENDYAGFGYPSRTEGIRSVVPHELFHIIQYAYDDGQPLQWTEGSAVWATEHLFGPDNADFERFLDDFLSKTFRPFDRDTGGFGDLYPYGAALWPYFLEHYAGVQTLVDIFAATPGVNFLDATNTVVAGGLEPTFAEFTRWNLFTGSRAAGGMYPGAAAWSEAPLEPALVATDVAVETEVQIEGMSARYVPLALGPTGTWRVVVGLAGRNLRAWVVPSDGGLDQGVELVASGESLSVDLPSSAAGDQRLVITGLSRGTITTPIPVRLEPAPDVPDDGGGCCSTSGGGGQSSLILVLALLVVRRRR